MGYLTRRRSSARRAVLAALSFFVMALAACGAAAAAQTGSAQPAKWVQKKLYFAYLGFTTHYSCDGLRDKVRLVLLQLGARKQGLDVHEAGCTAPEGGPEPFPAVAGTFYVLQPVSGEQAGSGSAAIVAAHWQNVQVRLGPSALGRAAQCELLEQVKEKIVPLFNARNVRFRTDCIPHQLMTPGAALEVDVLKPSGRP
jgi:hypothetical protein